MGKREPIKCACACPMASVSARAWSGAWPYKRCSQCLDCFRSTNPFPNLDTAKLYACLYTRIILLFCARAEIVSWCGRGLRISTAGVHDGVFWVATRGGWNRRRIASGRAIPSERDKNEWLCTPSTRNARRLSSRTCWQEANTIDDLEQGQTILGLRF